MAKYNLVLPIAGKAQRFIDGGYETPKPLIDFNGKTILEKSLESVNTKDCKCIFIVQKEHVEKFQIDEYVKGLVDDAEVIVIDYITEGALSTVMLAEKFIDNALPLMIFTPDCYFEPRIEPDNIPKVFDGIVCTFKSDSPAHSYVKLDNQNFVLDVKEKEVISDQAIGGFYYFYDGRKVVAEAKKIFKRKEKTKGEYYIAPIWAKLAGRGWNVGIDKNTKHLILGTPEDLQHAIETETP